MAKQIIKRSFPWILFLGLIVMIILALNPSKPNIKADSSAASVGVNNVAPAFSGNVAESPAVTTSTPVNVGSNVNFQGTATDANGDQYYLALCQAAGITAGNNAAPTCTGGNWCISSATNQNTQATCSYTTQQGDGTSSAWYAYACDKVSGGGSCTSVNQGSGDSGSPFYTNHAPTFTGITDNNHTPNPGDTVTVSTTSTDPDVGDTISLFICKSNDFNGSTCGGGGTWCSVTGQSSNPSCGFNIPTPTAAGSLHYYGYIMDSHNFASTGVKQGADNTVTVQNVAPVVSSVTLNGGSAIDLTESTSTSVTVTAQVSDNNGCADINSSTSSVTSIYRSGIGWSGCQGSSNENNCYALKSCVYDTGSCTGGVDLTSTFTCNVSLYYDADPTGTNTQYPSDTWKNTVKACDTGALCGNAEVTTGVKMNMLTALDVTSSIGYGSLNPGGSSGSDQTTTITGTGNTGLDPDYSGTDMASGGNTIVAGQQKYDFTGGKVWGSMDYTLSNSATQEPLHCTKTTNHSSPSTKPTYWRIQIPSSQASGSYTGTNTIAADASAPGNW